MSLLQSTWGCSNLASYSVTKSVCIFSLDILLPASFYNLAKLDYDLWGLIGTWYIRQKFAHWYHGSTIKFMITQWPGQLLLQSLESLYGTKTSDSLAWFFQAIFLHGSGLIFCLVVVFSRWAQLMQLLTKGFLQVGLLVVWLSRLAAVYFRTGNLSLIWIVKHDQSWIEGLNWNWGPISHTLHFFRRNLCWTEIFQPFAKAFRQFLFLFSFVEEGKEIDSLLLGFCNLVGLGCLLNWVVLGFSYL